MLYIRRSAHFAPNPFRQMNTGPGKHEQLQHSRGKDDFSVIVGGQSFTVKNISESSQVQLSAKKERKKKAHGQQPKYEREKEKHMAAGRKEEVYTGVYRILNKLILMKNIVSEQQPQQV